jgi:signal peptidase I
MTRRRRVVVELSVVVVIALVVSFGVRSWLARSFFIPSASMERTLLVGDRVIVNELVPRLVPLQRGDVIVFRDPGGWLGQAKGGDLIKRVIGLPGDRVTCCGHDGRLSVNSRPVDEPYVTLPPGVRRVASTDFDVTVPDGAAWVMGDNRWNSADSRAHGPVPISDVVGRAVFVSWPASRWSWLSR